MQQQQDQSYSEVDPRTISKPVVISMDDASLSKSERGTYFPSQLYRAAKTETSAMKLATLDDENSNLSKAINEDEWGFGTDEDKEAKAAEERRLNRQRRLERLAAAPIKQEPSVPLTDYQVETSSSTMKETSAHQEFTTDPIQRNGIIPSTAGQENENNLSGNESDGSDMFGTSSEESNALKPKKKPKTSHDVSVNSTSVAAVSRQDGFDDSDGYYKASIGETMNVDVLGTDEIPDRELKLRVLGAIGKGVFSSVLKCSTAGTNGIDKDKHRQLPTEVAIKCIRSNETMAKAALDEMKFLLRLQGCSGIVPLLLPTTDTPNENTTNGDNSNGNKKRHHYTTTALPPAIDFRGHTLLVFPYLPYNLRDVLQKFGKGVGLSLGAVRNYFGQLLHALTHLQKHRILHADLKPDNILVAADFSTVLLADFGSALEASPLQTNGNNDADLSTNAGTNEVLTPYLVSRYYRAPEIMLGLQPLTYGIDLWSLAISVGELFLGKVVLTGANNNDMLHSMMKFLGPFSGRTIKSHLLQTKKHPMQAHFSQVQSNYVFRQETIDPVMKQAVHREIPLVNTFKPTLQSKLLKARSPNDSRTDVLQFSDLLTKCLVLDLTKRISVKAALKHEFFTSQQQKS